MGWRDVSLLFGEFEDGLDDLLVQKRYVDHILLCISSMLHPIPEAGVLKKLSLAGSA